MCVLPEFGLLYEPSSPSVGWLVRWFEWSVGLFVCHNFQKRAGSYVSMLLSEHLLPNLSFLLSKLRLRARRRGWRARCRSRRGWPSRLHRMFQNIWSFSENFKYFAFPPSIANGLPLVVRKKDKPQDVIMNDCSRKFLHLKKREILFRVRSWLFFLVYILITQPLLARKIALFT